MALDGIRIINNTANAVTGGIKIGTTSGATDVLATVAVGANAEVWVPAKDLLIPYQATTGRQNYFVDAVTSWNSANLSFMFSQRRIFGPPV
jgi:hypothetical protein